MTKKEIRETLNALHIEKFTYARKCAERCFEAEMGDWETFTAINSLAVECNTIIATAEALGVADRLVELRQLALAFADLGGEAPDPVRDLLVADAHGAVMTPSAARACRPARPTGGSARRRGAGA